MNFSQLNRQIKLACSVCAGTHFDYDSQSEDSEQPIECCKCGRIALKRELMKENSKNIDEHFKDIRNKALNNFVKELNLKL